MGRRLRVGDSLLSHKLSSNVLYDDFVRNVAADTVTELGNGWTDIGEEQPADFDKLGCLNGAAVVRSLDRSTVTNKAWAPEPPSNDYDNYLDHPGTILPGICGAYQDVGEADVYCEVTWSGLEAAPHHTEGTPGVCMVPGTGAFGVGVWGVSIGVGLLIVSGVAVPPEEFGTYFIAANTGPSFVDGVPVKVGILTSNGGTEARLFVNREQRSVTTYGLSPFPIPAALHGSTKHGFFTDQHMVAYEEDGVTPSLTNMQASPPIYDVQITTR